MKFRYVGDDNSPPQVTTVFGYKFELNGNPVDVKESAFIQKLKGNKCFKEVRQRGNTGGRSKESTAQAGVSVNEPGSNI